jgi:hypothetical protein
MMKKGILILALGHPYYGKMAAALAATIRAADPEINIHLAWAGLVLSHLSEDEKKLFSSLAEVDAEHYTTPKGEVQYIRAKLNIYKLTPFEETMFLDCDVLWLKGSPADLMQELSQYNVTFPNFGTEQTAWAKADEIIKAYGPGKYYSIHSELIYFKRGEIAKEWFEKALHIYDNLKVNHTIFAGAIPDELPFSIAGALTETYPHKEKWRPIFWGHTEKGVKQIYEIAKNFWAVSMGGNNSSNYEILIYNILSKAAYYKLNIQKPYTWKQKRAFLPERKNL